MWGRDDIHWLLGINDALQERSVGPSPAVWRDLPISGVELATAGVQSYEDLLNFVAGRIARLPPGGVRALASGPQEVL